tara:strand:+ start:4620 stop:6026 length:1407 start_codon:yes stop_codon:yes gene_type:complete
MANGPRKELSFLDRALMNKAATQGGVLNFLGKQKEVTAPIRAQSHADSPPVQLAYITDAEKDLLVKSNIHGSLAGKPNPGPAGIASLDDFFTTPGGGIGGGSTAGSSGSVSSGGSAENYGIQDNQAVSDSGQVFQQQNDGSYKPVSEQQQQAQEIVAQQGSQSEESANLQLQNILESQAVDKAKKTKKSGFSIPPLGFMGLAASFLTTPTVDFLKSINGLSILDNQVLTTDAERKRYYEEHKDIINKAGYGSLFSFKTALEESPEKGVQGEESQYRLDPASYFDRDLYDELEQEGALEDYPEFLKGLGLKPLSSRFANTSGGLLKLAQSNITQYKKFLPDGSANPNYNPDFMKKVFSAREELNRMGKNQSGNPQGGGQPQGFPGIPGIPSLPVPKPGPIPPDIYPIPGQPPFMPGPGLPPGVIPPYGSKFEKTPYDYYTQSPQYRFRGVPSLNTEEFNEQLRNRFGIA